MDSYEVLIRQSHSGQFHELPPDVAPRSSDFLMSSDNVRSDAILGWDLSLTHSYSREQLKLLRLQ